MFAICSWLGLFTVGGNGHAQGKKTSVDRGWQRQVMGIVDCGCGIFSSNSVGYTEFPDWAVEAGNCATSSAKYWFWSHKAVHSKDPELFGLNL